MRVMERNPNSPPSCFFGRVSNGLRKRMQSMTEFWELELGPPATCTYTVYAPVFGSAWRWFVY